MDVNGHQCCDDGVRCSMCASVAICVDRFDARCAHSHVQLQNSERAKSQRGEIRACTLTNGPRNKPASAAYTHAPICTMAAASTHSLTCTCAVISTSVLRHVALTLIHSREKSYTTHALVVLSGNCNRSLACAPMQHVRTGVHRTFCRSRRTPPAATTSA